MCIAMFSKLILTFSILNFNNNHLPISFKIFNKIHIIKDWIQSNTLWLF